MDTLRRHTVPPTTRPVDVRPRTVGLSEARHGRTGTVVGPLSLGPGPDTLSGTQSPVHGSRPTGGKSRVSGVESSPPLSPTTRSPGSRVVGTWVGCRRTTVGVGTGQPLAPHGVPSPPPPTAPTLPRVLDDLGGDVAPRRPTPPRPARVPPDRNGEGRRGPGRVDVVVEGRRPDDVTPEREVGVLVDGERLGRLRVGSPAAEGRDSPG